MIFDKKHACVFNVKSKKRQQNATIIYIINKTKYNKAKNAYLRGGNMDIKKLEHWHFGMTENEANHLLGLVLCGKKRATCSSHLGYTAEDEPIPAVGDVSVITYFDGTPACIIRTVNVQIIPFCDMTFELASKEGEDDTLESWRNNHIRFFTAEGDKIGYEFTDDMPVVFEEFEVIEVL